MQFMLQKSVKLITRRQNMKNWSVGLGLERFAHFFQLIFGQTRSFIFIHIELHLFMLVEAREGTLPCRH